MCTTSNVNEVLRAISTKQSIPGSSIEVSQVTPGKVKQSRDDYFIVDVREPDEAASNPLPGLTTDANVPLGVLLRDASLGKFEDWKSNGKQILAVCNIGYRAGVAASELAQHGFNVAVLQRGLLGLSNPAATVPDLVVLLCLKNKSEKISLALAACAAAAGDGQNVVLILMSDGVHLFLHPDSDKEQPSEESLRIESIDKGTPFKSCKVMLAKFLQCGGTVLGCTTCVKNRGFEFSDFLECVKPMNMPDMLRMLTESKASLQFT